MAAPHERASAKWSPDGTEIISGLSNGRLFVVHPDGTALTLIQLQTGTQQYFAFEPHWSPDGTRIIFCMFINGGEGIYTANPDGSEVKKITFTTNFATLFNGLLHKYHNLLSVEVLKAFPPETQEHKALAIGRNVLRRIAAIS